MSIITISQAISLFNSGHVVAVPTETVYGLAASIKFPEAIRKIFEIKGRPNDKPLSLLVASLEQAWKYINDRDVLPDASTTFNKLAKKYWPGPLTIVVPANCEFVPEEVRVGQTTVGLRVPDSVDLLDVMAKTGPLAAPSANLSGQQPALSAPEVLRIFGEDFPVLDGGVCRVGEASTVVELVSGEMKILREGTIAAKDLRG